MSDSSLAVVVLTFNEEKNLEACLASVKTIASEIFVVDSGSADGTLAIAERHGAKIATHAFETHAKQWNWALKNLAIASDWIMALDADHRLTPELAGELKELLKNPPEDGDGFYVSRRQI